MSFEALGLDEALVRALQTAGYENPTEVQARAIPAALQGRDLRVCSSTGSGKTASFVLPALMRVLEARKDPANKPKKGVVLGPRILVLVPTRELSMQVAKAASNYGRHVKWLSVTSVVGGVPYPAQIKALRSPLDILIATPGRLIDHIQSGKAVLDNVEMLVLDEADRMLDMGFIEDIEHIADQLPAGRQTLMASATFDGEVGRLAQRLQKEDVERIEIAGHTAKHENITQQLMWADDLKHKQALLDHLLTEREVDQAVVFTSTQVDADFLANRLGELGHSVAALHGGMPQGRRNRVLQGLRSRQLRILVATDVAARGIDVPTITHVINYGLPLKAEDYVHRIGRTGRAGRSGRAVTLAERRDVPMIRRIQHYTTQPIPVATVEGLEPSRPSPELNGARRSQGAPGRGGRPGHGARAGGFGPGRGGDRGYGDRSYGDRRQGGGERGDRDGYGSRSGFGQRGFGDRPHGDRPQGERAFGDRSQGERSFGDRERSHGDRPFGDRPFGDRARGDRGPGFGGPRPHGGQSFRGQDGGHRPARHADADAVFERRAPEGRSFEPRSHQGHGGHGDAGAGRYAAGKPSSSKPRWDNNGSNAGKRPRKAV